MEAQISQRPDPTYRHRTPMATVPSFGADRVPEVIRDACAGA